MRRTIKPFGVPNVTLMKGIRNMKGNVLDDKRLRNNPFKTPDGYFQDINQRLMDALPDTKVAMPMKRKSTVWALRPVLAVAASVCVAVFGAVVYTHHYNTDKGGEPGTVQTSRYSSDDASDYVLMDNSDIYNYIAEL